MYNTCRYFLLAYILFVSVFGQIDYELPDDPPEIKEEDPFGTKNKTVREYKENGTTIKVYQWGDERLPLGWKNDTILSTDSLSQGKKTIRTERKKSNATGEIYEVEIVGIFRQADRTDPRKIFGFDANNVYRVSDDMLMELLATKRNLLLYVYPHFNSASNVVRQYGLVSKRINETGLPVFVAKICPSYFDDLSKKIRLYLPSIVLFREYGNVTIEYQQPLNDRLRTADHLYDWVRRRIDSGTEHFYTLRGVKQFLLKNPTTALAFMNSLNKTMLKQYEEVALQTDIPRFGVVFNQTVAKYYNASGLNVVQLRLPYQKEVMTYPEEPTKDSIWDVDELGTLVTIYQHPPVVGMTTTDLPTLESPVYKYSAYVFVRGNDPDLDKIREEYEAAAKHYRKQIFCYIVDTDNESNAHFGFARGVRMNQGFPRMRLVVASREDKFIKYRPETEPWEHGQMRNFDNVHHIMTRDEYINFFDRVIKKKVARFHLSEKIPEEEDHIEVEGAENGKYGTPKILHKIVGQNWKKVLKDPKKTAVVYFTGSWCMGCNHTIHTRLTRLALHYTKKGRTDLLFGFTDYTVNEYPDLKADRMPRLKMFLKDSDEEIEYETDESYCRIKQFIETNGKDTSCDKSKPKDPEDMDVDRDGKKAYHPSEKPVNPYGPDARRSTDEL